MRYLFTIDQQDNSVKFLTMDHGSFIYQDQTLEDINQAIEDYDFSDGPIPAYWLSFLAYGHVTTNNGNRLYVDDKLIKKIKKTKSAKYHQKLLHQFVLANHITLDQKLIDTSRKFKQCYYINQR